MNWKLVKREYPNTHDELKEYFKVQPEKDANQMMRDFLHTKGYNTYPSWIGSFRDYEAKNKP
jgi:hypothetical protein